MTTQLGGCKSQEDSLLLFNAYGFYSAFLAPCCVSQHGLSPGCGSPMSECGPLYSVHRWKSQHPQVESVQRAAKGREQDGGCETRASQHPCVFGTEWMRLPTAGTVSLQGESRQPHCIALPCLTFYGSLWPQDRAVLVLMRSGLPPSPYLVLLQCLLCDKILQSSLPSQASLLLAIYTPWARSKAFIFCAIFSRHSSWPTGLRVFVN